MADRWFLKLDGIEGDSAFVKHKGEIDVDSWSWGVNQSLYASGAGGGVSAGKASFEDFHFVAKLSKASPKLFHACATGTHIKQANLSGERGAGKQGAAFYKVRLDDVLVSSFQQSDSADDAVPMDQFSLNFAKIEVSYFPQDKAGKTVPPITAGWDVKQSKKF